MRPLLLSLCSSLVACVGMSVPTAAATQGLWGELEVDQNRLGGDYRSFDLPAADPELCRAACDDDDKCRAFTYVKPGFQAPVARCWLKGPVVPPARINEGCCVSGVRP
jgi:hypothetical protein